MIEANKTDNKPVPHNLIKMLKEGNVNVRQKVVDLLKIFGRLLIAVVLIPLTILIGTDISSIPDSSVIPKVFEISKDDDTVRKMAAALLKDFAQRGRVALPFFLLLVLNIMIDNVRASNFGDDIIEFLVNKLRDDDTGSRRTAIELCTAFTSHRALHHSSRPGALLFRY